MNLLERLVGVHLDRGGGDRVSYLDPDLGEVTYARLHTAARGYAGALRAARLVPGTRGLVIADDSVATVVAVLGMWWHGCVPVPVSPALSDEEIRFLAEDCGAGVVHVDAMSPARQASLEALFDSLPRTSGGEVRESVRTGREGPAHRPEQAAAPAVWPDADPVLVQYTSGSTGHPKGVLHSAAGIDGVLGGFGSVLALRTDDVVLSTAKLSFGFGFGNSVLFPLAAGARVTLLRGPVDAQIAAAALRRYHPTVLFSVPRMYAALLAMADSGTISGIGSLRLAVTAGEHCPAHLAERVPAVLGAPLVNGLGATELLHICVATSAARPLPGSTGQPVRGVTVTVRDEDGDPVPDGIEGRLHIAGPSVALGYLNRPDATARTFAHRGAFTGDIVRRTEDGDIRYVCRADDLLNLGGYKVAPSEIENVIRTAPGVAECTVVGATDADGLQQAVAYAVPVPGTPRDKLRRAVLVAVRTQLPPFKRPARVEVLDALPTTSTGKLARFQLRDREAAARR
ncbi:AMP-binding protein [Streptomyces sp. RB6PN25]|uniref:AMP-binding protein n=1 Tax=Streptomyces humicola TaxID=2953240 RepID=A0ABT1PTC3_9ACTN|nr:AMP-binding protein [Streptomyces humicola]MCQ4080922.1 AMP-binding protein [Streptomyces humicola]